MIAFAPPPPDDDDSADLPLFPPPPDRYRGLKHRHAPPRKEALVLASAFPWQQWPLAEFVALYCQDNPEVATGSRRTRADYAIQAGNFQRWLDTAAAKQQLPLRPALWADLTDANINAAMIWQVQSGRSTATANKLRRSLVALVRWGIDQYEFPRKMPRVKALREPKRKPRAWTISEFNQVLVAATQVRGKVGPVPAHRWWPALLLTIFNTGCRITAIMTTPTSGLDLVRQTLLVPAEVQKHGSDEAFDLLPITCQALAAIDPERNEQIFGDWPYDRSQDHWRALTRAYKKILVAAGLFERADQVGKRDLFHKIRRMAGSYVAKALGREAAQQMLGHSAPSVTDRYLDESIVGGLKLREILPSPEIKLPLRVIRHDAG